MSSMFNIFISYSSKDTEEAHELYRRLESFKIPASAGTLPDWVRPGRRLTPIFLDRKDLKIAPEPWYHGIEDALDRSRYLVVLCSPRSARAGQVDTEVRYFMDKVAGPQQAFDRIIPVIIDGEPWISPEEAEKCLPPSLLPHWQTFCLRNLPTWKEISGHDRAAGIFSKKRQAHWLAVQVAASTLATSPDRLWNSVQARNRFFTGLAALLSLFVTLTIGGLAGFNYYQQEQSLLLRANDLYAIASEKLANGEGSSGMAHLAASLKIKTTQAALDKLEALLLRESWLIPVQGTPTDATHADRQAALHQPQALTIGKTSVFLERKGREPMMLYSAAEGNELIEISPKPGANFRAALERPQKVAAMTQESARPGQTATVRVYDMRKRNLAWEKTFPGRITASALCPLTGRLYIIRAQVRENVAYLEAYSGSGAGPAWSSPIPIRGEKPLVSPDGKILVVSFPNEVMSAVRLAAYDTDTGAEVNTGLITSAPRHMAFSPSGRYLALVDAAGNLRLIGIGARLAGITMPRRLYDTPLEVDFSDNEHYLRVITTGQGQEVKRQQYFRIQINTPLERRITLRDGGIRQAYALPDGEALLFIRRLGEQGRIELRDPEGALLCEPVITEKPAGGVAVAPDASILVFFLHDENGLIRRIKITRSEQGWELKPLEALASPCPVGLLQFRPGTEQLLIVPEKTAQADTAYLWDMKRPSSAPKELKSGHCVAKARFSKKGDLLLLFDERLSLWRLAENNAEIFPPPTLPDGEKSVLHAFFNPKTDEILISGNQEAVYYDTGGQKLWRQPLTNAIEQAVFTSDGDMAALLTGIRDISLVETKNGKEHERLTTPNKVTAMHIVGQGIDDGLLLVSTRRLALDTGLKPDELGEFFVYDINNAGHLSWHSILTRSAFQGVVAEMEHITFWDAKGFSIFPGLSLAREPDQEAWKLAEALGGWKVGERGRLSPSDISFRLPQRELALTPLWQSYAVWLTAPAGLRKLAPGSPVSASQVIDPVAATGDFKALRNLLDVHPDKLATLLEIGWAAAICAAKREFILRPDMMDATPEEIETTWRNSLKEQGQAFIYSFPTARAEADFWTGRLWALHPDSAEALKVRFSFLLYADRIPEAELLLREAKTIPRQDTSLRPRKELRPGMYRNDPNVHTITSCILKQVLDMLQGEGGSERAASCQNRNDCNRRRKKQLIRALPETGRKASILKNWIKKFRLCPARS